MSIPKSVKSIGTQSSWNPDVIYGYSGSEAERFAEQNGYIFEAKGGGSKPPIDEGPGGEGPGGEGPGGDGPGGEGPEDGTGGNGQNGSSGGNGTNVTTGGSGTTVARSSGTSASRNIGTAQVQSGTPKTGIAFDARYVLCAGVFLAGACLAITRKKKSMRA